MDGGHQVKNHHIPWIFSGISQEGVRKSSYQVSEMMVEGIEEIKQMLQVWWNSDSHSQELFLCSWIGHKSENIKNVLKIRVVNRLGMMNIVENQEIYSLTEDSVIQFQ